jgi:chromosome segregation ATPase
MLEELDARITQVREDMRASHKLERAIRQAEHALRTERSRRDELQAQLDREEADVRRLEGKNLANLFHTILADREIQLKQEREEVLAARLKYDQACHQVDALEEELAQLRQRRQALGDVQARYEAVLEEKERFLKASDHPAAQHLVALSEDRGEVLAEIKELHEAIAAGRDLSSTLSEIVDALKRAQGWGTFDMLGGGFLATAVKRSHMDQARDLAHRAQAQVGHFERELTDIVEEAGLGLGLDPLESFADYFFDGLIIDWMVQSRIDTSLANARQADSQVESILAQLQSRLDAAQRQAQELEQARRQLIEQAQSPPTEFQL